MPAILRTILAEPARTRAIALLVAGWLLLNAALLWLYYEPAIKPLIGDENTYQRRALALLAGQPEPNDFIWPPGQVWLLGALYAVGGVHLWLVQGLQMALLGGCGVLLYRLWRELDSARAALCAAALFLLNPGVLAYAHWLWPEVPHLACLLGALVLLRREGRHRATRALAAGALIGAGLLFKSLLAALWPLLLFAFVARAGARWRIEAPALTGFVAGLLLATAPALWQGWRDTGRPLIADSSVYNLYVGLRDFSRSDYVDEAGGDALYAFVTSAATPAQRNAIYRAKIAEQVAERGLPTLIGERLGHQYFRLFNAKTLFESQLPGPACAGYLGAYAPNALAGPLRLLGTLAHAATLALAALGIALWARWRRPLALFVAVFFGYQLALYLGLHVMQRYLFPFMPFLCGFAGSALVALRARDEAPALAFARWRWLAGALLAALLLGLAFLGPLLDGGCG